MFIDHLLGKCARENKIMESLDNNIINNVSET